MKAIQFVAKREFDILLFNFKAAEEGHDQISRNRVGVVRENILWLRGWLRMGINEYAPIEFEWYSQKMEANFRDSDFRLT